MMFRWFALGLFATAFAWLGLHAAMRPHPSHRHLAIRQRACSTPLAMLAPPAPPAITATGVTVIDVAPGISPAMLPAVLHLAPGEHVRAVDDRLAADDLTAGVLIAQHAGHSAHAYLDLTVGAAGAPDRRVLVLMH